MPREVWDDLLTRLRASLDSPQSSAPFRGSLLDEKMFAIDVQEWGMEDLLQRSASGESRRSLTCRAGPKLARVEEAMRIAAVADLHFTPQA